MRSSIKKSKRRLGLAITTVAAGGVLGLALTFGGASLADDSAWRQVGQTIHPSPASLNVDIDSGTLDVGGAVTLDSTLAVTGATTLSGELATLETSEAVTADNTVTIAESNTTFYVSGAAATTTLPAVASATSTVFRIVVGAALTGDHVVASAEGDNIEGSLIVAGAVVDCDAEDYVTFVSDGENLGDYVEFRSNGTSWFINGSNGLTSAKITCTDPA